MSFILNMVIGLIRLMFVQTGIKSPLVSLAWPPLHIQEGSGDFSIVHLSKWNAFSGRDVFFVASHYRIYRQPLCYSDHYSSGGAYGPLISSCLKEQEYLCSSCVFEYNILDKTCKSTRFNPSKTSYIQVSRITS